MIVEQRVAGSFVVGQPWTVTLAAPVDENGQVVDLTAADLFSAYSLPGPGNGALNPIATTWSATDGLMLTIAETSVITAKRIIVQAICTQLPGDAPGMMHYLARGVIIAEAS